MRTGEHGEAVDRMADVDILDRGKEGATIDHVGGLPRFVVQGKVEIVGARETQEWLALLEKIREDSCVEVRGDKQKDV